MTQPVPQNRCPLCEGEVRTESSVLFGEIPCPNCGKQLWYVGAANEARFFDYATSDDLREKTYSFVAERLELDREKVKLDPSILDELNVDSLEALEMLMDLEEELGIA